MTRHDSRQNKNELAPGPTDQSIRCTDQLKIWFSGTLQSLKIRLCPEFEYEVKKYKESVNVSLHLVLAKG